MPLRGGEARRFGGPFPRADLGRIRFARSQYNPLYDANLRHFFGTKSVRSTLFRLGMVRPCWRPTGPGLWAPCRRGTGSSACRDATPPRHCSQVDRAGRVIDADQHKGKLHIIEQEFANVEREEEERRKEEAEIRRRVRVKRHEAIERAQQLERLRKIREDRRIRSEIVRIARGELMRSSLAPTAQSASRMRASEAAYRSAAVGKPKRRAKSRGAGSRRKGGRLARAGAAAVGAADAGSRAGAGAGGASAAAAGYGEPGSRPRTGFWEDDEAAADEEGEGGGGGAGEEDLGLGRGRRWDLEERGSPGAGGHGGDAEGAAAGSAGWKGDAEGEQSRLRLVVEVFEAEGVQSLPAAAAAGADGGAAGAAYVRARLLGRAAAAGVDAFGPATQPRATDQVPMGDAGALVWGQALPLPLAESAASAGAGVTTPLLLELVIPREFSAHDVAASVTVHLPLGDMLSGAAAPSTDPEDVLMAPPRARSLAEELAGGGRDGGSAAPLPEPSGPLARLRVAWHIEEAEP